MNDSSVQKPIDSDSYVVGIGSSAGGLEAIRELVKSLSENINAAYVVAQHMSPDHKSMLTELISRETSLSVVDVSDGMELRCNIIHVTPPATDVLISDGHLNLRASQSTGISPKPSVDRLFKSLADQIGDRAVGIVLSGTGSDGAYGIQAIRGAGGITIAQDDRSAKYDGMPVSAVETGCIDLVLSPIQIGTHLAKILEKPRNLEQFRSEEVTKHPLSDLLQIVLARTRVDFREYKPMTIQRRLERRMTALGITNQAEYTSYCRANPHEVDALFKDFLISVTRFFRDPLEFEAMRPIIGALVREKRDTPIRVWVAGCATGEEAYSIAMLFAAEMEAAGGFEKDRVQIFATDIDRAALKQARQGRYSSSVLDDIPAEFAEKYLTQHDDFVQINPEVKGTVLFSEHNICNDPPFLHQDLICCRNLLIYFGPTLQAKVLSRLNYSMAQDGYLFLGTAESGTVSNELFRKAPGQNHIMRMRVGAVPDHTRLQRAKNMGTFLNDTRSTPPPSKSDTLIEPSMFEGVIGQIADRAILLTSDLRIARVFGDISDLVSVSGDTRLQFDLSILLPEIAQDARTIASIANRKQERRTGQVIPVGPDKKRAVRLEAMPLRAKEIEESFVLITINSAEIVERRNAKKPIPSDDVNAEHIRALQSELDMAREALQQTIEELETSNEEYQSTNEELQSSNEELQATNEELETSNEELQSTNEELVTVNEELQVSKQELETISEEQRAILASVAVPLIIVDNALQITTLNDAAIQFFGIDRPEKRMHISQLKIPRGFPDLIELCDSNLRLGKSEAVDFKLADQSYSLEIAPFFSQDGQVRGATLALA